MKKAVAWFFSSDRVEAAMWITYVILIVVFLASAAIHNGVQ